MEEASREPAPASSSSLEVASGVDISSSLSSSVHGSACKAWIRVCVPARIDPSPRNGRRAGLGCGDGGDIKGESSLGAAGGNDDIVDFEDAKNGNSSRFVMVDEELGGFGEVEREALGVILDIGDNKSSISAEVSLAFPLRLVRLNKRRCPD